MTEDVTVFLAARYAEAEAAARELLRTAQDVRLALQEPRLLGRVIPGWHSWADVEAMCDSRLADIALKRAILAEHEPIESIYGVCCVVCVDWQDVPLAYGGETEFGIAIPRRWPCPPVRLLAAEFSASPSYRPQWARLET
jgi:hypothetical protein